MAPSHYLNQCWLLISEFLWHSSDCNFTVSAQATFVYNVCENYNFKFTATSPREQWVILIMIDLYWLSFAMNTRQNEHIISQIIFTIYVQIFSWETEKCIYNFYHSSILTWRRSLTSFLMKDQDLTILHTQYHGRWWPSDARSQGINSHDIDLIKPW